MKFWRKGEVRNSEEQKSALPQITIRQQTVKTRRRMTKMISKRNIKCLKS
jgi:hypothetical protein